MIHWPDATATGFLTAALATAGLTTTAAAAPPESRPVCSSADAIRETAWVETGTDHDRDGRPGGHRLGLLVDPALPHLGDTLTFDLARTSVTVGLTKPEH